MKEITFIKPGDCEFQDGDIVLFNRYNGRNMYCLIEDHDGVLGLRSHFQNDWGWTPLSRERHIPKLKLDSRKPYNYYLPAIIGKYEDELEAEMEEDDFDYQSFYGADA